MPPRATGLLEAPPAPLSFSKAEFDVRLLFPTPVAVAPVNEAAGLNRALTETIMAHARATPGVVRSNDGGWQSDDDFEAWSGIAGGQLLEAAVGLANSLTARQTEDGLRPVTPNWRINAWANVNVAGHSNHPHNHAGAFWSGVYWVDAGQSDSGSGPCGGEFEMLDPRGILPAFYAPQLRYAVRSCLSAGHTDYLVPRSGTMVLFPAWLVHSVRRYSGARARISVAFNLAL